MINVLIVEDEREYARILDSLIGGNSHRYYAENCESACEIINATFLDLIILDLNIPLNSNPNSTESPNHGHTVFAHARAKSPGTPIIVLTGSSAEDFISSLIEGNTRINLWGNGREMSMVAFHTKHNLDKFPILLENYLSALSNLSNIELNKNNLTLTNEQDRLIRIFSLKYNGARAEVNKISGGLSSAKVFRIKLTNGSGDTILDSICKIGSSDIIKCEHVNYESFISRLNQDATPRKLAVIEHGAKDHAAVFYSLADGFTHSIFDKIMDSQNISAILGKVETHLIRWNATSEVRISIREIRRLLLEDDDFNDISIKPAWVEVLENNSIQVKMGCAHCDLHGFNILVSEQNIPVLIDYGDISSAPSCLDPITLELCIHYHPESPFINSDWPSLEQAKNLFNLDIYLDECPFPEYIISCRNWSEKIVAGKRELAAGFYSYLLRQLKYPNSNKPLTLAFLEAVKKLYDET
ncbi:response regulator [Enterobacter ludwigii]|uniref:response regulator n=1 Tax=Enterobacter ludwigii TaxID=299767 RepID=UPI002B4BB314|nr:response regulator [Enterobacter ludwigii]WRM15351.1 response regulator [Enterobacter ludwigii]